MGQHSSGSGSSSIGPNRRQFLGACAGTAAGAALAGCGGGFGSNSKSKTISVLTVQDPFFYALKPLLPEFQKKTGIKVNMEGLATPTLYSRSTNMFLTRQKGIDVISPDSIHLSQYANAGWLMKLDDLIKRDNKDLKFQDFIPQVVYSANEWKGSIYTIPVAAYAMDVLYRKDVFDSLGLDPPPSKPSADWTWDKYVSTIEKVNGKTVNGTKMHGTVVAGAKTQPVVDMYTQLMVSMGARWFKAFPDAPKWDFTPELDSKANVQGLTIFERLFKSSPAASVNYVWFDAGTAFAKGGIGMMYWWTPYNYLVRRSDYMSTKKSPIVENYGIGVLPQGATSQQPISIGNWSFGIGKYSENVEESWTFIKWASSAETQKKMALQPNQQFADFARKSLYDDQDLLSVYDYLPSQLAAMELGDGKVARTPIPIYATLNDQYGDVLNQMISQNTPPAQAAASSQKAIMKALKDASYIPYTGASFEDTQNKTDALISRLAGS